MDTKALIVALGGNARVSRVLGVSSQAISQWIATDEVPASHRIAVWELAIDAGLDWTPPGATALREKLRGGKAA